jgi:hypothetical protein
MARINLKRIKEQSNIMSSGWKEGAAATEFNGITLVDFDADRAAAQTSEDEVSALEAQLKIKKDVRDGLYEALEVKRVKVGRGVAGHKDFGDDSEAYGAMGFVRKSERKSGLTFKKPTGGVPG